MKNILLILPIIGLFVSTMGQSDTTNSSCESLDWVVDETRTQGGGRVWFKGHGKADSEVAAFRIAENNALYLLKQECQYIPKNTQFIERCSFQKDGIVLAYTRATTLQQDCTAAKNDGSGANKNIVLEKQLKENVLHKKYEELKSVTNVHAKECKNLEINDLDKLSESINVALELRGKKLSFPEDKFNHLVKEKLVLLDSLTKLAKSKTKQSKCQHQIIIDAYEYFAMELIDFVPEGRSADYISSFKKAMREVHRPILENAQKLKKEINNN